jgi:hypothetical protein
MGVFRKRAKALRKPIVRGCRAGIPAYAKLQQKPKRLTNQGLNHGSAALSCDGN